MFTRIISLLCLTLALALAPAAAAAASSPSPRPSRTADARVVVQPRVVYPRCGWLLALLLQLGADVDVRAAVVL